MAEKKSIIEKLHKKNKLSEDEDSDDYETDASEKELDLPLDKLNLGPKKKLIVLCLGGLLVLRVHRKEKAILRGLPRPDVSYGNFSVFKRPFCTEFLSFCFERFEVGIWSSAREDNIEGVLTEITGGKRSKLLFVWSQEECNDSGFGCLHKEQKPLFLKEMKDLWASRFCKGKFTSSNTLLIDDEPHTCLLNPPNTAVFPNPYKEHDRQDTLLRPNSDFCKYLDGIADAKDVTSYVKDHPFGQLPITVSHPDWAYYSKILRHFGKKEEKA